MRKEFTRKAFVAFSIRGYSSVVEHSTADREVPSSNLGAPLPEHFAGMEKISLRRKKIKVGREKIHEP